MLIDKTGKATYGATVAVSGANPAANAECSITVPAGQRWLLSAVSVQLVQGASQTPWPTLKVTDGTNVLFQSHAGTAAQAASTTSQVSWFPGAQLVISGATTAVISQGGMPRGLILEAGSVISTVTTSIGANTDYGVPWATIIRLPSA